MYSGPVDRTGAGRARRAAAAWLIGGIVFAALVGSGLHGFSLPVWHRFIDGSPEREVLLGRARVLRWDDTTVHVPLALSQRAQTPRFPVVNPDVGLGQNMLVPVGASLAAPVAHPTILFRPTLWGWFLGDDAGLAWMWWMRVALGVLPLAWVASLLGARPGLALACAALFAAGPGFQLYSWNGAPYVGFAALAFGACVRCATSPGARALAGWSLLLGWATGCFALALYPPFQVTVGWVFVALLSTWCAASGVRLDRRQWTAVGAGAGLALVSLALFLSAGGETLGILASTSYPGQRISSGGDVPFWIPFSADLFAIGQTSPRAPILQLAGSFALFFPISAWLALRGPAPRDRVALVLSGVCVFLFVYEVAGIPRLLARLSLLSFAPGERTFLALGAADALLLARVLSAPARAADPLRPWVAAGWMVLLAGAALGLHRALPETSPPFLAGALLVHGAFAWWLLSARSGALGVAALALLMALSTLWFNPLVRGGSGFLRENDLARRIAAIDSDAGGDTVWASYASLPIGNLFRMVGVRAISGVHGIPQLELWSRIDPDGHRRDAYNRFAHVLPALPEPRVPMLSNPAYDALRVALAPDGDELARLGVTHLLVDLREARLARGFARWQPDERIGHWAVYALPVRGAGGR